MLSLMVASLSLNDATIRLVEMTEHLILSLRRGESFPEVLNAKENVVYFWHAFDEQSLSKDDAGSAWLYLKGDVRSE